MSTKTPVDEHLAKLPADESQIICHQKIKGELK